MTESIAFRVWRSGPQYVAEADDFSVIAYGDTAEQAVDELRVEIANHLRWLEDCGDMLAPRLSRERDRLTEMARRAQ